MILAVLVSFKLTRIVIINIKIIIKVVINSKMKIKRTLPSIIQKKQQIRIERNNSKSSQKLVKFKIENQNQQQQYKKQSVNYSLSKDFSLSNFQFKKENSVMQDKSHYQQQNVERNSIFNNQLTHQQNNEQKNHKQSRRKSIFKVKNCQSTKKVDENLKEKQYRQNQQKQIRQSKTTNKNTQIQGNITQIKNQNNNYVFHKKPVSNTPIKSLIYHPPPFHVITNPPFIPQRSITIQPVIQPILPPQPIMYSHSFTDPYTRPLIRNRSISRKALQLQLQRQSRCQKLQIQNEHLYTQFVVLSQTKSQQLMNINTENLSQRIRYDAQYRYWNQYDREFMMSHTKKRINDLYNEFPDYSLINQQKNKQCQIIGYNTQVLSPFQLQDENQKHAYSFYNYVNEIPQFTERRYFG